VSQRARGRRRLPTDLWPSPDASRLARPTTPSPSSICSPPTPSVPPSLPSSIHPSLTLALPPSLPIPPSYRPPSAPPSLSRASPTTARPSASPRRPFATCAPSPPTPSQTCAPLRALSPLPPSLSLSLYLPLSLSFSLSRKYSPCTDMCATPLPPSHYTPTLSKPVSRTRSVVSLSLSHSPSLTLSLTLSLSAFPCTTVHIQACIRYPARRPLLNVLAAGTRRCWRSTCGRWRSGAAPSTTSATWPSHSRRCGPGRSERRRAASGEGEGRRRGRESLLYGPSRSETRKGGGEGGARELGMVGGNIVHCEASWDTVG
jgi:hypothetical protein